VWDTATGVERQSLQQKGARLVSVALTPDGATLVTGDAEFSRVPGLALENWLQPWQDQK
jgi:predicted nucleic acid-binding protein